MKQIFLDGIYPKSLWFDYWLLIPIFEITVILLESAYLWSEKDNLKTYRDMLWYVTLANLVTFLLSIIIQNILAGSF